jgi:CheY-like chemotaxis protein/signal transduction histidine kinase
VQHFVNPSALERAAAEVFSSARARYYVLAAVAVALCAASGFVPAAAWVGLVLLLEQVCRIGGEKIHLFPGLIRKRFRLLADLLASAALAVAPTLAWQGRADAASAVVILGALATYSVFHTRHGRLATLAANAPFAMLGLYFLVDAAAAEFATAATALALSGFVFAAALHHTHRAKHERMLDVEQLRQLNTHGVLASAMAWEANFRRRSLIGAEKLAALTGHAVSFDDVVAGLFAPAEERALVRDIFTPGCSKQIILEHDIVRADGSRIRVRHQGFMRAAPDGTPERFSCISRQSGAQAEATLPSTLATIEMSHAFRTPLDAIIGYTEILYEDAEAAGNRAIAEDSQRILIAAHRLLDAIATRLNARAADSPLSVKTGETGDLTAQDAGPLALVIDSQPQAREATIRALRRAGFAAVGAETGQAGLKMARARAPVLIVLDAVLADCSGWSVLERLKQDERTASIPAIVLSAAADRAQALALGAAEHIAKPVERDVLAAAAMRFARLAPSPQPAAIAPLQKQTG